MSIVKYILFMTVFLFSEPPSQNLLLLMNCERYGKELAPTYLKRNCVQFLDKILKIQLSEKITKEISDRIYIHLSVDQVEHQLKIMDSTFVTGVCYALTNAKLAEWIKPKDSMAGDIFQYWNTVGFTNGHCGIIKSINSDGTYTIYSSHQETKGFGTMKIEKPEYFFIVRLK
jgi:hypothetical protein